jgi:hypothetical protein
VIPEIEIRTNRTRIQTIVINPNDPMKNRLNLR